MIKYVGTKFSQNIVALPKDAKVVHGNSFDLKSQMMITMPIITIILIITILVTRKEIKKQIQKIKEYLNSLDTNARIKYRFKIFFKMIVTILGIALISVLSTPVHELLHLICLRNIDVEIGWYAGAVVIQTMGELTKYQFILCGIMPTIVIGVVPFVIGVAKISKSKLKVFLILVYFVIVEIYASGVDLISTYNVATQVPNGSYLRECEDELYYYFKE